MNPAHQVDGNRLTLLQNGAEYFPRLCADIDAARHTLHLETYIFAADETAHYIADALRRAAARGVAVRLMLDGFGSAGLPQHWVDDLRASGVEVLWYRRRISPLTLRRSRLRRLHRKLVVLDGEIAFIGGINIIDDVPLQGGISAPRLDYAVRIEGPAAGEIHAAMRELWGKVAWASLRHRVRQFRRWVGQMHKPSGEQHVALVLRDNLRHRRDIERAYLKAIVAARHEIVIASAYFLPGRVLLRALKLAARRGVRVVLLLQGRVEYRLQHYATHALYAQLLAAGIEVHEYLPSHLHAKVAVVDGEWATVGSSNIDPFSLLLAREANLVVRDAGFAAALRAHLLEAITGGGRRVERVPGGLLARGLARVSYALVRLLVSFSGIPKRH